MAHRFERGGRIGPYQLLFRLGVGGMGEVWAAQRGTAKSAGKPVALKVLRNATLDTRAAEMFLDEARTAVALRHPNIVPTYEVGVDSDLFYIAMQLIPGPAVNLLLERASGASGRLSAQVVAFIGESVARALAYAHDGAELDGRKLHLVHRDVSPQNILIDTSGRVFLTDFGVARTAVQQHKTLGGELRGKPGYMAPEQVQEEPLSPRSDIFALGVVMYEMATLQRVFKRKSVMSSMLAVMEYDPPPICEVRADFPKAISSLVESMMRKRSEDRPSSSQDLADLLRTLREDLPPVEVETELSATIDDLFGSDRFDVARRAQDDTMDPLEGLGGASDEDATEPSATPPSASSWPRAKSERYEAATGSGGLLAPTGVSQSPAEAETSSLLAEAHAVEGVLNLKTLAMMIVAALLAAGGVLAWLESEEGPPIVLVSLDGGVEMVDGAGDGGTAFAMAREVGDAGHEASDSGAPTAAMTAHDLLYFVRRGRPEQVREALEAGSAVNGLAEGGWAPLHAAVHVGRLDMVELLIELGAEVDLKSGDTGATPLHLAARYNQEEIADYLLDHGARPDVVDLLGDTALHAAVSDPGHTDARTTQRLIKGGADLRARGQGRHTPLIRAAIQNDLICLEALLEAGADVDLGDERGATALWHAAALGRLEAAKLLLARKAKPLPNEEGVTPSRIAEMNGFRRLARTLLPPKKHPRGR